jgi:hypothetical protein
MIIELQGGLGNQLFQFAYGRSYCPANETLYFDTNRLAAGNPPRKLQVDAFVPIRLAPKDAPDYRLSGYWQNEKYFYPGIRKDFAIPLGPIPMPVMKAASHIRSFKESAFVGVRRGDYLWPERADYHGVLPIDYYREALSLLPDGKVFIFSDDPEWCHKNMVGEVIDVTSEEEKPWDIWLMSLCTHAIIANSTFHWWGAWLGPDVRGTVIAPKNWFKQPVFEGDKPWDIVPERWTKL